MTLVNESPKEFWFGVIEDLPLDFFFYQILYYKKQFMSSMEHERIWVFKESYVDGFLTQPTIDSANITNGLVEGDKYFH